MPIQLLTVKKPQTEHNLLIHISNFIIDSENDSLESTSQLTVDSVKCRLYLASTVTQVPTSTFQ